MNDKIHKNWTISTSSEIKLRLLAAVLGIAEAALIKNLITVNTYTLCELYKHGLLLIPTNLAELSKKRKNKFEDQSRKHVILESNIYDRLKLLAEKSGAKESDIFEEWIDSCINTFFNHMSVEDLVNTALSVRKSEYTADNAFADALRELITGEPSDKKIQEINQIKKIQD